jgi:hypothetical protein
MELRVRATVGTEPGTVVGYYPSDPKLGRRRKEGEEFVLNSEKDFSHRWMQAIGWEPPAPKGPLLPPPGEETAAMLAEQNSFVQPKDMEAEREKRRERRRKRKGEMQIDPPTEG